jgi:redox-sensitive bicupin YhaK (pirin superfamily)
MPGCAHVPRACIEGVTAYVLAGEALGARSPIRTRTPAMVVHFVMEPSSHLHQPIPEGWAAFV